MAQQKASIFLLISLLVTTALTTNSIYYSSCSQSTTSMVCEFGTNLTERLLSMKKGGSDPLSVNNFMEGFFYCEEYNYNCGYLEDLQIQNMQTSNGIPLSFDYNELISNIITNDATLTDLIKPYLQITNQQAKCVSEVFPLILTDPQSLTLFNGFMTRVVSNISTLYDSSKASYATAWTDLNINIKTAIVEVYILNINTVFTSSIFWNNTLFNNFALMSSELKTNYTTYNCIECLRSAYLIDSVTVRCNKYQSINFLIDESGSIGAAPFQYAKDFLDLYVQRTNDDLSIMSIHFYDGTFDPYIYYGNDRATILSMIDAKSYRGLSTMTGDAINNSIAEIAKGNYPNGVPKILVVMTDGVSYDEVLYSANYARANDIILFCIAMGANVDVDQLKQIAGTESNIVYISAYNDLSKLVDLIENYFCKQIIDVLLDETIYGNVVRVPTSPSYFRVQKSPPGGQYYQLEIYYEEDPETKGEVVMQSQFDPFPDQFSEYALSQQYRTSITTKIYFISPENQEQVLIKKYLTETSTFSYSYISVGGDSLNFNITLRSCADTNCTVQRKTAATIGSLNFDNASTDDSGINIFIPISISLGMLGLCTTGVIYGAKQIKDSPDQINLDENLANEEQDFPPQEEDFPPEEEDFPPEEQGFPPEEEDFPPQNEEEGFPPQNEEEGFPPGA